MLITIKPGLLLHLKELFNVNFKHQQEQCTARCLMEVEVHIVGLDWHKLIKAPTEC